MPELPEVETIARTLAPQVQGKYILRCNVLSPKAMQAGAELLPALAGAKIAGVRRRAKLLLLDLAAPSQPLLAGFHLKMTGKLFVHPVGTAPHKHSKLIFELGSSPSGEADSLMFFDDMRTFGYCRLMRPEETKDWPFWNKLGIEPLQSTPEEIALALQNGGASKTRIKAALLDQERVVGIGNIYADEALFRAGIRPDAPLKDISTARLVNLGRNLQEILQEAIAACGSSIRDYRDAQGNAGAFQNNFRVYGRGGQPCKICQATLVSTRVAGRGTVFCENCQTA